MKKILGSLFLTALLVVGMSSVASAAATCANQAVTAGFSCSLGDLTFTFSNVSYTPTSTGDALSLEAVDTGIVGNDVILGFQINPGTAGFPVDIILDYTVTSTKVNITGIDASYAGTNGSIFETASYGGNIVSTININNTGTNNGVVVFGTPGTFGPVPSLLIHKDIDAINFSEFTDSVVVGSSVPEPMTLSMMGVGLLGLSLISRRRKKS